MSRKSLLVTVRPSFFNLNLSNFNLRFYLLGLDFLKNFNQLMIKKGIILNKSYFNLSGNTLILKSSLFISTGLLKRLKAKSSNTNYEQQIYKGEGLLDILKKTTHSQRIMYLSSHFTILNKNLEKKHLYFLFKNLKKYIFKIFVRRFNLFIDFIKITSLYIKNLVDLDAYLLVIAQIFKHLRKKAHISFYGFIKKVFNTLIAWPTEFNETTGRIRGVKIRIKGRLLGKSRASHYKIQVGSVPVQTMNAQIYYAQATSFTNNCGTFGFEIWANR